MRATLRFLLFLFGGLFIGEMAAQKTHPDIVLYDAKDFEKILEGKQVKLFTLCNNQGMVTQITNYGGKVVSLWVKDKNGNYADVVLGFDSLEGYLNSPEKYFGALIGRYGNRIAQGRFSLDGKSYDLATNNGDNHLHGGDKGYDAVVWEAEQLNENSLQLRYTSPAMEEGYPGYLKIKVLYTLTEANALKVEYWATTDAPTVVNLTHHSFFNLKGAGKGSINDHILQINASKYTPVDAGLIPTGEIAPVADTPFDFRKGEAIGSRLHEKHQQLEYGLGYDHNFVLEPSSDKMRWAATVTEPQSGRVMEVYTNEPGLQFYGGNFLDGSIQGKQAKIYGHRGAFCLETQHFPDSPNQPQFPTTRLDPGEAYTSVCVYRFTVED
ncbi:aldose epimerase family protein [Sediminicola luteus]|uniref:Aldose 1-epimerase n=1 Tax=Sediminicola luteus TaxID=319238 RepID=A0A2A4G9U4_9FLAO|nr:aldose epimerase family protein [Sediminicola luteus]PCE64740.1 galactose-1-epimerase [Sediminicola luteus]